MRVRMVAFIDVLVARKGWEESTQVLVARKGWEGSTQVLKKSKSAILARPQFGLQIPTQLLYASMWELR